MDRLLQATARAERDHFWFKGFRRFMSPLIEEAVGAQSPARILDCGCGTGNNLAWLRQYGRTLGIDLTWTGLAFAHAAGERGIAQATVSALPFPAGVFHVVTSFDVLYALEQADVEAATREMFRVLRPGGHLVLNVAALELLKGNHSVLAHEVQRYNRKTLTAVLSAAGFEIRRMSYTNATIFPLIVATRLAQRVLGHKASSQDLSIPPAPLNAVLSSMLAIEAGLLRITNMPIGSSLMALARKPESNF